MSTNARRSPAEQTAILCRGCDHIETRTELEARIASKERLTVKFGIDPTGSFLHLGHAVVLHKLQEFVELGHRVILLIGDFTARIGDPTGRNEARPRLTDEEIGANMRDYREQAGRVLDLARIEIMYNSQWLAKLTMADIVELASHTTVAQMLARNDFAQRYAGGIPIALHEFLYPVTVAYDSVAMRCDVELGGSDQLFNLLLGRHYQERMGQARQICMTTPILEGTDGVVRMGKSRGNYIGLTEPASEMFGKLMSVPDAALPRYEALAAFRSDEQIAATQRAVESGTLHPMDAKKDVAAEIVTRYHGASAARAARERFEATVQRRELPKVVREQEAGDWRTLAEVVQAVGFAASKREAERLIVGGGVKLDGVPVMEPGRPWTGGAPVVVSVGARRFVRVVPKALPQEGTTS